MYVQFYSNQIIKYEPVNFPDGQSNCTFVVFFCELMYYFSPDRPREMRESPSGRNLPLAVSMTTSQSSTPAAAQMARPPGRVESACLCA